MSLSAQVFGRDSLIHRATNILGLGIPGWLDRTFGPKDMITQIGKTDTQFQGSDYGGSIPRQYATCAMTGSQIIWMENNQLREVVKEDRGGKGGSNQVTETYTYFASFILLLKQGKSQGIRRIWCADKLIYNAGSDDLETIIASNLGAKGWRFYDGSDDQMPDPRYEAEYGVGNVPAFRGYTYIAFYDFALKDFSNTLQAAQFKVELYSTPAEAPTYIKNVPYLGTPVGESDGVMHTAEVTSEVVSGGFYQSQTTFRTYSLTSGLLVDTYIKSGSIEVQGSSSLSFYETYPIVNIPGEIVVHRKSGTALLLFSTGLSYSPTTAFSFVYEVYHGLGEYWIVSSDGLVRMLDAGTSTVFTLGNRFAWMPIRMDETAGRKYLRYQRFSDGALFFGEFDADPNAPIWQYQVGATIGDSTADKQVFAVDDDRVLMGVSGAINAYEIGGSSLALLGDISYGTGGRNVYDVGPKVAIAETEQLYQYSDRIALVPVPLADILRKECLLSELITSADLNTSLITAQVNGLRVPGGEIREAIQSLQTAYQFYVVSSGYQIKFVPGGMSSVVTVPWEDLAATDGDEIGDSLPYSREMDSQLPQKVTVTALSAAREYASSTQSRDRPNTSAVNTEDLKFDLVLTDDEIAQIAEKLLFLRWLERDDFSFTLPPTYLGLEPADVITVQAKFGTFELRLTEVNYSASGRLECSAKANNAANYTSNAPGATAPGSGGTIPISGPSVLVNMDIPLIDETIQNSSGFVAATTGYTEGWPGCVVVRSNDSGQTWSELQAFVGKGTIGKGRGLLSSNSGALVDQSSLIVDMISGELESVTYDQMLNGSNIAAYGYDGRWEIVRFQNASLQMDGSYLLSGFVRGDKGTEWATGLHAQFDWFVLLDDPDNDFLSVPIESRTLDRLYRAVTRGSSLDAASDIHFAYQGVNLKPLSPVLPRGARNGSGDLSVSFTRRSRIPANWWVTGVPAPVGETSESYQADVMSGSTVKRTINATTPSFTYVAADQIADFGSPQASITLRIYQMSSTVGRGYPREVTL